MNLNTSILTLVFLELRGVVLRQTIAKFAFLFTYETWHLFNLHSLIKS